MADQVIISESADSIVIQETVTQFIEVIIEGPTGSRGDKGDKGDKGDAGDVNPEMYVIQAAAESARNAAQASSAVATTKANEASASATSAATSATSASNSAAAAALLETEFQSLADVATNSATTAITKASEAVSSADSAAASATSASLSADSATGSKNTAASSAANASTSATNAAASATSAAAQSATASTKASEASASALSASGYASAASASATAAATSATQSESSKISAGQSASTATTKASEAAASASGAATSASIATTQASTATTKASEASTSATSAAASATSASTYASTATTKASEAAASASSAATSAANANAAVSEHAGAADPHGVTYPITPGGNAVDISGADLNGLYRTGFFRGTGLINAPAGDTGWWHVLIQSHDSSWVKQIATSFSTETVAHGVTYERVCVGGFWQAWARVYKGADVVSLESGRSINISHQDLSAARQTGFYRGSTMGNAPIIGTWFHVTHEAWPDGGYATQLAVDFWAGNRMFRRTQAEGNWSAWRELPYKDDFIGAFSGAGDFNTKPSNKIVGAATAGATNAPVTDYGYGLLHTLDTSDSSAQAQVFISHAGDDLCFRGGWNSGTSWQRWNRVLTDQKNPRAWNMDQYVRTTDSVQFAGLSVAGTGSFSGNVGIGTSSPSYTLDISAAAPSIRQTATTGTYSSLIQLVNSGGTAYIGLDNSVAGVSSAYALALYHSGAYPITFSTNGTERARIDSSGNLLVGVTSGSAHTLKKDVAEGTLIADFRGSVSSAFAVWAATGGGENAAATALAVVKNSITNRSINAGGTINASGADYAEYERNNGLKIAKGSVVGFKSDGTLTLTFSEAIRFAVKSTDPSYVGGDVWGSEAQVGKRPEQPVYTAPAYTGPQEPVEPTAPTVAGEDAVNDEADDSEYLESLNAYQDALNAYNEAQTSHAEAVTAAEAAYTEAMMQYEADKAAFEERLEAARQAVDRIAYSGKVPVNCYHAEPGQYLIAAEDSDGGITCVAVWNPNLAEYLRCIGRVNKVLPDGRAEIAVIIH